MFNEPSMSRAYRKSRRAESEAETRQRIAAATSELHGTLGPARTTVSAIAERAGVQRATVYRHFPDDASLFEACSAHWVAANAPPDPSAWASVSDPDQRARAGLDELYIWFERTEQMLENLTRDAPLMPALAAQFALFSVYFEAVATVLLAGRVLRGARRRRARAAIGHATSFATWRSLVGAQGLSRDEAVAMMVRLVAEA
jgi:AcrR family transcriptional regulator